LATVPSLRARALKALGRREHSRLELQAKLQPFAENPDELDALLDELEKRGWLSEARFVEQLTTTRRRKFGAARIVHELREKGVSDDAISAAHAQLKAGEVEAVAPGARQAGALPGRPAFLRRSGAPGAQRRRRAGMTMSRERGCNRIQTANGRIRTG
jgi:regulatory protein